MFSLYCALVTPFTEDDLIDFSALKRIIDRLIAEGIDGFVILGTTAETPTLTEDERWMLYHFITNYVDRRVKIIAGIGTNNTQSTLKYLKMAEACDIDGVLLVTPYYNLPTQEGLYQHVKYIADKTSLPILLYNVKKRCGCEISSETITRLCYSCGNIYGVKQAGGAYDDYLAIKQQFPQFKVICGEDDYLPEAVESGMDGIISVTGHVLLPYIKRLLEKMQKKIICQDELDEYHKITKLLFCETSPSPIKYALSLKGEGSQNVRLPLVSISDTYKNELAISLSELEE